VFTLVGEAISWRSCKQMIVASSTMYAEFIACFEATNQMLWLKKFIPDLKVVDCIDKPLKMYCDNQPTIFYAHNSKSSKATRPIEVKYYIVKDKIQDHTISLEHRRTKDMLADPLMKGLPSSVFKEHLSGMDLMGSLSFLDHKRPKSNRICFKIEKCIVDV
jgi:hypothetical protein